MGIYLYGLKCDNNSCDYKDMSIKVQHYKDYINHPCPKCSSPLLKQEEYDKAINVLRTMKLVEYKGLSNDGKERVVTAIHLNGAGISDVNIKK